VERWQSVVQKNPHRRYSAADQSAQVSFSIDSTSNFRRIEDAWVYVEKYLHGIVVDMGGSTKSKRLSKNKLYNFRLRIISCNSIRHEKKLFRCEVFQVLLQAHECLLCRYSYLSQLQSSVPSLWLLRQSS